MPAFEHHYPHPDDLIEPEIAKSSTVYTARELAALEIEQAWCNSIFWVGWAFFAGFLAGLGTGWLFAERWIA